MTFVSMPHEHSNAMTSQFSMQSDTSTHTSNQVVTINCVWNMKKSIASTWSKKANASKNCVTEGIDINCSRFIWLWHDSNCILFESLIQLRMLCKRVKNSLKTCSYPLSSVRYGIEIVIKEVRHFFFRHKSHKMNRQNVITAFNKKKRKRNRFD